MYRVSKPRGVSNVTVENTDTCASVMIGRVSMEIIDTISVYGAEPPDFQLEWSFAVNKDCASALTALALKMKKPIRDQRKVKEDTPQKIGVEVDAFDLIYGI